MTKRVEKGEVNGINKEFSNCGSDSTKKAGVYQQSTHKKPTVLTHQKMGGENQQSSWKDNERQLRSWENETVGNAEVWGGIGVVLGVFNRH